MGGLRLRPFLEGDVPLFRARLYEAHVAGWYERPADWLTEVQNRHGEFCRIHPFIAELDGAPLVLAGIIFTETAAGPGGARRKLSALTASIILSASAKISAWGWEKRL